MSRERSFHGWSMVLFAAIALDVHGTRVSLGSPVRSSA